MYNNPFSIPITEDFSINLLVIVFSFAISIIAANYDRNGLPWFLLSLIITPLITFLILTYIKSPIYNDVLEQARVKKYDPCEKFKRGRKYYDKYKYIAFKKDFLMDLSLEKVKKERNKIAASMGANLSEDERHFRSILGKTYDLVIAEKEKAQETSKET